MKNRENEQASLSDVAKEECISADKNIAVVEQLNTLCEEYNNHPENALIKYAKDLPTDVLEQYKNGNEIIISRIIDQIKTGYSLYWVTESLREENYRWHSHSSELHPELYLVINKYKIVRKMIDHLNDPKLVDSRQKINAFNSMLTEENKQILSERMDSNKGVRFLEKALNILTVGIYSKLTKGTFQFWKSHGEVFADKSEDITHNVHKLQ